MYALSVERPRSGRANLFQWKNHQAGTAVLPADTCMIQKEASQRTVLSLELRLKIYQMIISAQSVESMPRLGRMSLYPQINLFLVLSGWDVSFSVHLLHNFDSIPFIFEERCFDLPSSEEYEKQGNIRLGILS